MPSDLPIVYVRGYAGPASGIDRQVDDPFYGFNAGATHVRANGDGEPVFYQFESPLLRLISDEDYRVIVQGDQRALLLTDGPPLPAKTIWIHRFYDYAATTFGTSVAPRPEEFDIERAADRLYDFILDIRRRTGAPRVFLVAHSMGGLVCRCMMQKLCGQRHSDGKVRLPATEIVDRLFTWATPHRGIEFDAGGGLLDWAMETFGPAGSDIFSPAGMRRYLVPDGVDDDGDWLPNEIPGSVFPIDRVFCAVGTDAQDYGVVEKVVGPKSDGLVHIENAYCVQLDGGQARAAHRAFVHRSHSGRYGIVNSEEGYQNLRRFLFGRYQASADLVGLRLPADDGREKRSWQADVRLSVRGLPIVMHEQLAAHYCPVQLSKEAELGAAPDDPDTPVPLVSTFLLDSSRSAIPGTAAPASSRYTLSIKVFHLSEVHGTFFWQHHLEQVADWEDILIVDVGRRDHDDPSVLRAWATWNSSVAGPIDDFDPATQGQDPLSFTHEGEALVAHAAIPEVGQAILGRGTARMRLTVQVQT